MDERQPTRRELAILKVLWDRGEASVREVYDDLKEHLPIVQNTVQAFLRTMESKGLVCHRREGRTFIYRAVNPREATGQTLVSGLLDRVFDGAVDQLVASALSVRKPTPKELERLRHLVERADREASDGSRAGKSRRRT